MAKAKWCSDHFPVLHRDGTYWCDSCGKNAFDKPLMAAFAEPVVADLGLSAEEIRLECLKLAARWAEKGSVRTSPRDLVIAAERLERYVTGKAVDG